MPMTFTNQICYLQEFVLIGDCEHVVLTEDTLQMNWLNNIREKGDGVGQCISLQMAEVRLSDTVLC